MILPLEQQACSLELAKKLKDLGVKQESLFVWEYFNDNCYGVKFHPFAVVPNEFNKYLTYSAYTSAELGEMLPAMVNGNVYNKKTYFLYQTKENGKHIISYDEVCSGEHLNSLHEEEREDNFQYKTAEEDTNEANARAKMLIYLIENKLIEIPK